MTSVEGLVSVRLPLYIDTPQGRQQLRTHQISMRGLSLTTRVKHELGQSVRLIIEFPEWQFRQDAEVRLIQERFVGEMVAVSFVALDEDDAVRLHHELSQLASAIAAPNGQ